MSWVYSKKQGLGDTSQLLQKTHRITHHVLKAMVLDTGNQS